MIYVILWIILGCGVLAYLDDRERRYYKWLKEDPTYGVLAAIVILLWPILAYLMWRYK